LDIKQNGSDSNHHTFELKAIQYVHVSIYTFERLSSAKTNFKVSWGNAKKYNNITWMPFNLFGHSISFNQDTPAAHDYQSREALKHPRLAYLNLGTVRKTDEANLRYPFMLRKKRQIEIEHMSQSPMFRCLMILDDFSVFIIHDCFV